MESLETKNGNFAIEYEGKFFFVSGDLKRVIREICQEEFDHLCEVIEPSPDEKSFSIPEELVKKLDKEVSFIEDASMLEYFRNAAFVAVYPFLSLTAGPISIEKLSENRSVLLGNAGNYSYDCCAGNTIDTNEITFHGKDKSLLGKQNNACTREYASNHDPKEHSDGETVIEAIARLGISSEVAYIRHYHYDNGDYNDRTETRSQTVYLNDLSLDEILEEVRKAAESAVVAVSE